MDTMIQIIGHVANAIYAVGFMVKNMLWLRIMMVIGCLFEIAYALLCSPILWVYIFWGGLWIAVNLVQLALLLKERMYLTFTEEESWIHKTVFSNFTPVNFKKIMKLANWRTFEEGEVLVDEDVKLEHLILIYEGNAGVEIRGRLIAYLRNGNFAGEMSFISGNNSTAKVAASVPTKCLIWNKCNLVHLMQKFPEIESGMKSVFNIDLLSKLVK